MLYTNVLVRNWEPWKNLGVNSIHAPNGFHTWVSLDIPVRSKVRQPSRLQSAAGSAALQELAQLRPCFVISTRSKTMMRDCVASSVTELREASWSAGDPAPLSLWFRCRTERAPPSLHFIFGGL